MNKYLLTSCLAAAAATPGHSLADNGFMDCLNDSLLGSAAHACAGNGEANSCVGMRRALENSEKRERCLNKAESGRCRLFAYKQNSEAEWVSVAAGHLQRFNRCVADQYGGNNKEDTWAAFSTALKDEDFLDLLKKTNDGALRFGLKSGEILDRSLRGESFSDIIRTSPAAKKMDPERLLALTTAADSPNTINPEDFDPKNYVESTNPAQEGEHIVISKNDNDPSPSSMQRESIFIRFMATPDNYIATTFSRMPAASKSAPSGNNNVQILKRSYNFNPYSLGLDRSLFERVSHVYRKETPRMKAIDDYVAKRGAPRDYKELLRSQEVGGL